MQQHSDETYFSSLCAWLPEEAEPIELFEVSLEM